MLVILNNLLFLLFKLYFQYYESYDIYIYMDIKSIIILIVELVFLMLIFFLGAKRCHDYGSSGWWQGQIVARAHRGKTGWQKKRLSLCLAA